MTNEKKKLGEFLPEGGSNDGGGAEEKDPEILMKKNKIKLIDTKIVF